MSFYEALVLGIVQGLTEFFPVSSSGHLVLFETLLGAATSEGILFEVALHVATLVAIALFYHRRIAELVVGTLRGNRDSWRYVGKLVVGTLPAGVVGFAAKDWIAGQFSQPLFVGVALLLTGGIVWSTRSTSRTAHGAEPSWGAALAIGFAQAFAILPGISRSGSTVAMELALGVAPRPAAEFSFLLGIIAISGAAVLTLPELGGASAEMQSAVITGGLAALVTGIFAIWLFVRMLQTHMFHWFALWAWAAGAFFLGWQLF
jgi:undecaprenyl-diphosphatase